MRSLNTNTKVGPTAYRNQIPKLKILANPKFLYEIIKMRKRFEALRSFTVESGQEEIERLAQLRKESSDGDSIQSPTRSSRNGSTDSSRSPLQSAHTPSLSDVPEETSAFAIGDADDSDDEEQIILPTPSQSTPSASRSGRHSPAPSGTSSVDDAVPLQLRGMSEKARGKMPVGQPSFSRVNSMTSVRSDSVPAAPTSAGFEPSAHWVEQRYPKNTHFG